MKKILIIVAVIAAIGIGIGIYLKKSKLSDFQPQIKERLSKLVSDASNGLYILEMDTLQIDVISSKIILVNARLRPDSLVYAELEQTKQAPNDLFDITVDQLSIDDIKPADFFANKEINLRRIFINRPVVRVYHKKQPYNIANSADSKTIYDQIKKDISSIRLDTIILQNIDLIYTNRSLQNKQTRLSNIKVFLADVLIDSSTQFDKNRFLYARNCAINLKDYFMNTGDSLYRFSVDDVEIQTIANAMTVKGLHFAPRLSRSNFYKRVKHQQDFFNLNITQVLFERVHWWELLAEEQIETGNISLQNGSINIFNDKSQTPDKRSKVGKYPHQLLMKLAMPLKIDTVNIKNLDLAYTELNPKSGEEGTVTFENVQGIITHITNMPAEIKIHPSILVKATARFMGKSPLSADFTFNLPNYKKGIFKVQARVGEVDAQSLNKITMPLGLLQVNSVRIKSLDATISGDNYRASGTVKMIYDDLKVTALKSSGDTLKKRGLLSFVANTFVIKKENPRNGQPPRVENAQFTRIVERSFFNLVWKTIFTGAGKTVGYNKK